MGNFAVHTEGIPRHIAAAGCSIARTVVIDHSLHIVGIVVQAERIGPLGGKCSHSVRMYYPAHSAGQY